MICKTYWNISNIKLTNFMFPTLYMPPNRKKKKKTKGKNGDNLTMLMIYHSISANTKTVINTNKKAKQ